MSDNELICVYHIGIINLMHFYILYTCIYICNTPRSRSSWNTFIQLRDLNLDRLKSIVDDLQNGSTLATENSKKLSIFFNAMMDHEKIEARGIEPLLPIIDLCKTVRVCTHHYNITSFILCIK